MAHSIGDIVTKTSQALYGDDLVDVVEQVEITKILDKSWVGGVIVSSSDTRNPRIGFPTSVCLEQV